VSRCARRQVNFDEPLKRSVRRRLYGFGPVCGRFTSSVRSEALAERFQIVVPEMVPERYNVAPGQPVLAIRRNEDLAREEPALLRWGLIPHWAKDTRIAYKMINARAETLLEKSSYRSLVGSRRCLIIADGFYEWRRGRDGRNQPIRFSRTDDDAFAFAGLWTRWTDPESNELIETCTIITTTPNEMVALVHDRMPVILPPELEEPWLDPEGEAQEALSFLQPYPAVLMKACEASPLVNSVRNDFPALLKPEAAAA
jgi:putative SOS response-associated peptidase YedK